MKNTPRDRPWFFSTQDCMNMTGLCDKSVRRAKSGLKEKGYWDDKKKVFHQYPTGLY